MAITVHISEGSSEAVTEQIKSLDGIVKQCAGVLNTFMPKLEECLNDMADLKARVAALEGLLTTKTDE